MPEDRGFLLIDKPADITSFDVIRALRRISPTRRIGHCGTLDPFATGLLICALGPYTRLINLLEALPKTYAAKVKLGEKTTTGDTEGEVCSQAAVPAADISFHSLTQAALSLRELAIPAHSAVKISGQRAYTLARQGIAPEMPSRAVQIHSFQIISWRPPYLSYECTVSKGTYIRSLSQWIAQQLGTVGYTSALRRLAIGAILVDNATSIAGLNTENLVAAFQSPEKLFPHLEAIHADPELIRTLHAGQNPSHAGKDQAKIVVFSPDGGIACLASRSGGILKPLVNIV